MKYRKKPVVVEAFPAEEPMDIETLEGTMHANAGDYIITGVEGERYPCKPDIFKKTYEPADAEPLSVDRDALLALADEIYDTSCDNHGELTVDLIDIWGWAQAICDALGVSDHDA